MTRLLLGIGLAALLAVASIPSSQAAGAETQVSAAASGAFPDGASLNGVSLQGSTFGLGVLVDSSGSAVGDVLVVLEGTSLLGQPQSITLEAKATSGAVDAGGGVTFSGTGTLDLGDGSVSATVPFGLVVTTSGLQLTIAGTQLPAQTLGAGSIFIG